MKILKINSQSIDNSGTRLDASYHLSDGIYSRATIYKSPFPIKLISEITSRMFYGGRDKRTYVKNQEKGLAFMGSSDMLKSDLNALKFISEKFTPNISNYKIEKDWVLISRSGTVGNTAYANEDFENKCASEHIIRVVANSNFLSGYLYAYLSSSYGYNQLIQGTFGNVIQHIEPHHIENIPIPILPEEIQQKIHNLILEVSNLRVQGNKLLLAAISLFDTKINKSKATLGFQHGKISYKKINKFHKRLDSQFQLVWNQIEEEKSADLKYIKLSLLASKIFVGGRGKRNYVENGIPFLSSSDMMLFNPKRNSKKIGVNTKGLEEMKVDKNDILISRSGTVGNTVIVGDDLKDTAISEHALRLVIDSQKISPHYVFAYLKTKSGKRSMEASAFGSVIITLNEDLIGNIKIPILEENFQEKITSIVKDYILHFDRATLLENEAIDLIEKEIDQWQQ